MELGRLKHTGTASYRLGPFSTMTCFRIHSAYYMVISYSFRNSCGGSEIVKTVAINFLTSIDPS
ncbi:hypothetical protein E2C01_084426 [Portunus trituberculatus]|uniref:Uncharacterized protein n=1 Tax=Portunus trituberculatus TaxID=210409 RepID=A0A5B7J408_PORTR|nr:hypothetical protein [Portunus trituberculatus]